jgi:hypothetical protein
LNAATILDYPLLYSLAPLYVVLRIHDSSLDAGH